MIELAQPHVLSLEPYIPGRTIDHNPTVLRWAKMASNENCLGASPAAVAAVSLALDHAHMYPNAKRLQLITKICEHHKGFSIRPNQIALGSGSSELIVNLVRALVGPNEAVLFPWPTFVMYRLAAMAHGCHSFAIDNKKAEMTYDVESILNASHQKTTTPIKLVFLANPNNPTGNYLNKSTLNNLVKSLPKYVVLVIDEAYFEYVVKDDYPNGLLYALSKTRTLVLRSFSKIYGLAGLRAGYAIGDKEIIDVLCRIRDPFNVNSLAQSAALAALDDNEHVKKSIFHNLEHKPRLANDLSNLGFLVHEGVGNFVIAKPSVLMPSVFEICSRLLAHGVIIRPLEHFGLSEWMRITVGTEAEIGQLLEALPHVLI
jgi:histidinol-phosphate aminotransferase